MEKRLKIIGILCVIFGGVSVALCLIPIGIFFAILFGFIGMMLSTIYIFIDNRYQLSEKKITPGIIGIALSSIPILLIVVFNIINHFNK